jgi:hypothetical protein
MRFALRPGARQRSLPDAEIEGGKVSWRAPWRHQSYSNSRAGLAPGEFDLPHAIAVAPNGLYIADRENGRVQRFTSDGRYLGMWEYGGRLFSVAFGTQDDLYLTVRSKLSPADADGWLVRVDKNTGRVLGRIESPVHLISSAPDGSIFIGTNNGGVLVFKMAT